MPVRMHVPMPVWTHLMPACMQPTPVWMHLLPACMQPMPVCMHIIRLAYGCTLCLCVWLHCAHACRTCWPRSSTAWPTLRARMRRSSPPPRSHRPRPLWPAWRGPAGEAWRWGWRWVAARRRTLQDWCMFTRCRAGAHTHVAVGQANMLAAGQLRLHALRCSVRHVAAKQTLACTCASLHQPLRSRPCASDSVRLCLSKSVPSLARAQGP